VELTRKLRAGPSATIRTQIQFLLLGSSVATVGLVAFVLLLPTLFGRYEFILLGNLTPVVFCGATAYAIATRGMFDLRSAIVRSVVAVMVPAAALLVAVLFVQLAFGRSLRSLPRGFLPVTALAIFLV